MVATQAPVSEKEPTPQSPQSPAPKTAEPLTQNVALLVSVLAHLLAIGLIGMSALLAPHRPSVVPVFELVNLEPPKLRPLEQKVAKPPEPPPPEPEPTREPDPPKLTPKPTNAVQPKKKPEPKIVKHDDDLSKPVKEVVHEQQVLENKAVVSVPTDPILSFWATRVTHKVDVAWKPTTGVDVTGDVKVVINFTVSRDGTITSESVAESSGNSDLDEMAVMTFKRIGTVPPIPENWPNDQIEVRSELTYHGH